MKGFKLIIITSILISLLGCDKNEDTIFLKGNIVGFTKLVDESGNELVDKSGIEVSIKGLSVTASTNEKGRFEFTDLPAGTYNLNYNKTGYGTYKIFSYQFIGGNIPGLLEEIKMYEQPTIEVQNLELSYINNIIHITGKIPETSQFAVQSFVNDSVNVSNLNYDFSSSRSHRCCFPTTQFSQSIYLDESSYSIGDEIYLVIYFINPHEEYRYFDHENGQMVFSSYQKASSVVSLILE